MHVCSAVLVDDAPPATVSAAATICRGVQRAPAVRSRNRRVEDAGARRLGSRREGRSRLRPADDLRRLAWALLLWTFIHQPRADAAALPDSVAGHCHRVCTAASCCGGWSGGASITSSRSDRSWPEALELPAEVHQPVFVCRQVSLRIGHGGAPTLDVTPLCTPRMNVATAFPLLLYVIAESFWSQTDYRSRQKPNEIDSD